MSRRTDRVGEQLRREIARILHEEATDPRIALVTLTRVDVAPDFSSAAVYWSSLAAPGDGERSAARAADAPQDVAVERIGEGLASAAPFVRRRLARVLPLKRTPELRFRYDASMALGSDMLSLLRELADDGEA